MYLRVGFRKVYLEYRRREDFRRERSHRLRREARRSTLVEVSGQRSVVCMGAMWSVGSCRGLQ